MAHPKYQAAGPVGRFVDAFEENVIAILLGAMTILTFANVVRRYVFNASLLWSLEVVLILFSWLVLFGVAWAFKVTAHLGVDAVTALFATRGRRLFGLISGFVCILYALLVLKGAWDYWAPFADLPKFTGRVFPTGFDLGARRYGFTETGDVPIPFEGLRLWLSSTFNSYEQGGEVKFDLYSDMPVLVPYAILPLAGCLILLRVVQATLRIWRGDIESLIVSHEAGRRNAETEEGVTGARSTVDGRRLPPGAPPPARVDLSKER